MSQQRSVGAAPSFESARARTSCFVMGTRSTRANSSSGSPGARGAKRGAASVSTTFSGAKLRSVSIPAGAETMRSSALPSVSATVTVRSPSPASVSVRQISAGASLPPVRKKTGFPPQTAASTSQSVPCADESVQSCHGRPSRAASSCRLEMPGSTRTSCPASSGRSLRAPE